MFEGRWVPAKSEEDLFTMRMCHQDINLVVRYSRKQLIDFLNRLGMNMESETLFLAQIRQKE